MSRLQKPAPLTKKQALVIPKKPKQKPPRVAVKSQLDRKVPNPRELFKYDDEGRQIPLTESYIDVFSDVKDEDYTENEYKYLKNIKEGTKQAFKRRTTAKKVEEVKPVEEIGYKPPRSSNPMAFVFDAETPDNTQFPAYCGEICKAEFLSIANKYKLEGVLNSIDASVLLVYAKCVERFHEFELAFHTGDYLLTLLTPKGATRSPEAMMHQENMRMINTLGGQLGVTPSSRQKMNLKSTNQEEKDPLMELIAGRRANAKPIS